MSERPFNSLNDIETCPICLGAKEIYIPSSSETVNEDSEPKGKTVTCTACNGIGRVLTITDDKHDEEITYY